MYAANVKNVYLSGELLVISLKNMIEFYFFNTIPGTNDWIDSLVGIGNLIVSLFTVWLAWKISKKFSVKQKIIEKQLEAVISLNKSIKDQIIRVQYIKTLDESYNTTFRLQHICRSNFKEMHPNIFTQAEKTYYVSDFFEKLNFLSYMGNELLPQSIIDSLEKIQPIEWTIIPKNEVSLDENYKVVFSNETPSYDFGFYNIPSEKSNFQTTDEFLQQVQKLMMVINDWLDSVEASDIKFRWDQKLK